MVHRSDKHVPAPASSDTAELLDLVDSDAPELPSIPDWMREEQLSRLNAAAETFREARLAGGEIRLQIFAAADGSEALAGISFPVSNPDPRDGAEHYQAMQAVTDLLQTELRAPVEIYAHSSGHSYSRQSNTGYTLFLKGPSAEEVKSAATEVIARIETLSEQNQTKPAQAESSGWFSLPGFGSLLGARARAPSNFKISERQLPLPELTELAAKIPDAKILIFSASPTVKGEHGAHHVHFRLEPVTMHRVEDEMVWTRAIERAISQDSGPNEQTRVNCSGSQLTFFVSGYDKIDVYREIIRILECFDFDRDRIAKSWLIPSNLTGQNWDEIRQQVSADFSQALGRYVPFHVD